MSRLLITGTNSGCGKTTVTCALLSALKTRGALPTAFKSGPDYIDPMFHRAVTGIPAYNLDPFFLDGNGLRSHLAANTANTANTGSLSVIEGAMGYYDGIATSAESSAYTVACETKTPVILVINARGASNSLIPLIEGFVRHKPDSNIKGIIFNGGSEARRADFERIANEAGVIMYGFMPYDSKFTLPSRNLGLLTAPEIENLQEKLYQLGRQAEQTIDIEGLLNLAKTAPNLGIYSKTVPKSSHVRLAMARDNAFCFIYEENLELLQNLGCEIIYFSPIYDKRIPENVSGLYLPGGYPELYADLLSSNVSMRDSIKTAVLSGLPTVAECGGFMYLHENIGDFLMCGVIKGGAFETKKLRRFGYITLTAQHDNLLCKAGESIRTHEFHYWDSTNCGDGFTAHKAGRDISYSCIHATESLYAGFPHIYFPSNTEFAKNLIRRMEQYGH